LTARVRVIGVGQADRGDDAVGLTVAEFLRANESDDIDVVFGAADAAALLAQLEGFVGVVAVDCASGGGAPGTILRLHGDTASWPPKRATSSHGNALADALALGAALDSLPRQVSVFAVVGENFDIGEPLSAAVSKAVPELVHQVLQEATCMKPD
jgi:hydrogenase maturation protease